jgi:hypothetical protein
MLTVIINCHLVKPLDESKRQLTYKRFKTELLLPYTLTKR